MPLDHMNQAEIKQLYGVMFTEYPDIVGVKDIQKMLGIGKNLAYSLVSGGYIKGITVGNKLRIPKINVIRYAVESTA